MQEIAEEIKVSAKFLRAIEEGSYDLLPNPIYTRGFIRNYAAALNLDPEKQVLPFYRREMKSDPTQSKPKAPPQPINKPRLNITPKVLFVTVASVAIILFLGALFWQYRSFANQPVLIINQPAANVTITTDFVTVSGRTDTNAWLTINGETVHISEDGDFRTVIDLKKGVNRLELRATNQLGKETVKERVVTVKTAD